MSDHGQAALERIRQLAERILVEAGLVHEELQTTGSSTLFHVAELLVKVARDV